jgi:hypothetical protein
MCPSEASGLTADQVEFWIECKPFGICLAVFSVIDGKLPDYFEAVIVYNDDNGVVFYADLLSRNHRDLIIVDRLYQALNGYDTTHAENILTSYLDTGDLFGPR